MPKPILNYTFDLNSNLFPDGLSNDLPRGSQLEFFVQPIVPAADAEFFVTGEFLARGISPDGSSVIPPACFISKLIAQEEGEKWLLTRLFSQAEEIGSSAGVFFLNVSLRGISLLREQLLKAQFATKIIVELTEVERENITREDFVSACEHVRDTLRENKNLTIAFALDDVTPDDLGLIHALTDQELSYIKLAYEYFPVWEKDLDFFKSLMNIVSSRETLCIVFEGFDNTTIDDFRRTLATTLEIDEDSEAFRKIISQVYLQGYGISRPVNINDFMAFTSAYAL